VNEVQNEQEEEKEEDDGLGVTFYLKTSNAKQSALL